MQSLRSLYADFVFGKWCENCDAKLRLLDAFSIVCKVMYNEKQQDSQVNCHTLHISSTQSLGTPQRTQRTFIWIDTCRYSPGHPYVSCSLSACLWTARQSAVGFSLSAAVSTSAMLRSRMGVTLRWTNHVLYVLLSCIDLRHVSSFLLSELLSFAW